MSPIIQKFYFSVYMMNNKEKLITENSREENVYDLNIDDKIFNTFSIFESKSYLKWNNKHLYYDFQNKFEFLSNLLKELNQYCSILNKNEKYFFPFFMETNKIMMENYKLFLIEKFFHFTKNINNFLKNTRDIKKLITPIIDSNSSQISPNSPNIEIYESDFITLLDINYNAILTFFEGLNIVETLDKKEILDIIDENINKLKNIVEEFFYDNMITVIYPNNDIKEDLLSNFRKGIIEKTLKFYEFIYIFLDLQKLWDDYDKFSKVIFYITF